MPALLYQDLAAVSKETGHDAELSQLDLELDEIC